MLSVLDVFKVGIGPSSSHTLGPMVIARRFLEEAEGEGCLEKAERVLVDLYGSLALTGIGHATDRACVLGLLGERAETIETAAIEEMTAKVESEGRIALLGRHGVGFEKKRDVRFAPPGDVPDAHPNGMRLTLLDGQGEALFSQVWYSVGGGFVRREDEMGVADPQTATPAHRFTTGAQLLAACDASGLSIADVVLENEDQLRPREETLAGLDAVWRAMAACIERGLSTEGELPGGLQVARRAPALYASLTRSLPNEREALFDWLNVFAMAVNEENAAGGQVVTAPTNGAAGLLPSVVKFYCAMDGVTETGRIRDFLLTAGGIALLYKEKASISGAEMGCQGEVGVACSMAAAGLAAVWGGTPRQVEHAAEIGMEHNLGLTCDPVGGLVQIPCIERNAIGAVKAVNAARLALRSGEAHKVSLDQVIETMRQTGKDMNAKYKETSEGGLAVNVVAC
ncbi:L-serine ammonia-lyase [Parvularcula dongshanensis]|uniref:L-serine dehydratase n=1 Tax=Parvularcula dongshanensis TaxID=1173995 RepID=A0A840I2C8_9PROT|nr:L-serine ammonia-lyase [Parvularcula dongshanensis]MBB4659166.1 L-serine dehydratase [Parvularcula dongshanensis]